MEAERWEQSDLLISEFRRGNESAFQELFRSYYPALCYFSERLLADPFAAEEVAQDSLLKLWDRHAGFDNLNAVKAFLYITAKNGCLKLLQKNQRYSGHLSSFSEGSSSLEGPFEFEVIRTDVYQVIYDAIEKLPPQCAKILRMSYLEGYKNHEIAELLQISEQTVKNQKVKALKLMKGLLPRESYLFFTALMYGVLS